MRGQYPLPYVQCCPPSGSVLSGPGVALSRLKDFFVKTLGYLRNPGSSTPWGRALSCSSPSGSLCCRTSRILGCSTPVCLWSAVAPSGVERCRASRIILVSVWVAVARVLRVPCPGSRIILCILGSIVGPTHECYRVALEPV